MPCQLGIWIKKQGYGTQYLCWLCFDSHDMFFYIVQRMFFFDSNTLWYMMFFVRLVVVHCFVWFGGDGIWCFYWFCFKHSLHVVLHCTKNYACIGGLICSALYKELSLHRRSYLTVLRCGGMFFAGLIDVLCFVGFGGVGVWCFCWFCFWCSQDVCSALYKELCEHQRSSLIVRYGGMLFVGHVVVLCHISFGVCVIMTLL